MKPQEADLIVRNGYILTMDPQRRLISGGAVAIQGRTIVGVGLDADIAREFVAT